LGYVHGSPLLESPTAFMSKESVERTPEALKKVPLRSMGRTIAVRVVIGSTGKGT